MNIVLGAVISLTPFSAGMAWNWMQLASGLRRLGHRVFYVEQLQPHWCLDESGNPCSLGRSVNRRRFASILRCFGLAEQSCQIYNNGEETAGLPLGELLEQARDADLLINIAGHIEYEPLLSAVRRRAYFDQDPVYTQLWHDVYGKELGFSRHEVFFTVGLNIGTPRTHIPDCGRRWHPALPVVVLDDWPVVFDPEAQAYTTIASWSGFRRICYQDRWYLSKYEEFRRFASLPTRVSPPFEAAMRRHKDENEGIQLLKANGWRISHATDLDDLDAYQRFIARSRAEIGIAKNAYVQGRSGWFSDRAAHYLASGKPVLAQGTGFEAHLPTGRGLIAINTLDDAVAAVESVEREYEGHCRAARQFAADFLDYRVVLPRMLEQATA